MEKSTDNKQGSTFYELMGYALDACAHFRSPADTAICVVTDGHSVQHLFGGNSVSATIALAQTIQAYPALEQIFKDALTLAKTAVRAHAPEVLSDGVSENEV